MIYIYLLKGKNNFYKIGISKNVLHRLSSINCHNPEQIVVVTAKLVEDAPTAERMLHQKYAAYKTKESTEWFEFSPETALKVCIEINELKAYEPMPMPKEVKELSLILINTQKEMVKTLIDAKDQLLEGKYRKREEIKQEKQKEEIKLVPINVKKGDEELLQEAKQILKEYGRASASLLQRRMRIGYSKAARLLDILQEQGYVGEHNGSRPRDVFIFK